MTRRIAASIVAALLFVMFIPVGADEPAKPLVYEYSAKRWLDGGMSYSVLVRLQLEETVQARSAYDGMTNIWRKPYERQVLAEVHDDICEWWESTEHRDKAGMKTVLEGTIAKMPPGIKCGVRITMLGNKPEPHSTGEANCQVLP